MKHRRSGSLFLFLLWGGIIENITYRNLHMTNVGIPILIYASYKAKDKEYRNLENKANKVSLKKVY